MSKYSFFPSGPSKKTLIKAKERGDRSVQWHKRHGKITPDNLIAFKKFIATGQDILNTQPVSSPDSA